ncbi:GAF and ANTAR domain-containing protein [Jatrophihabitans telluris]|uniref:GAF and ANTAR domain-containing protein n=1 Tax=Jatrophihabitans telluris TaxID=2038343 RepID=A0ABY4R107_9ACTN|nr:GAF and ANTAR domain-containing protein [Jatrophihabitans telluris]
MGEVARAAVHAIPGTQGAGVTLLRLGESADRVQCLGASDPFVEQVDVIQYELMDEGPCITAAQLGRTVVSAEIGQDGRWPRFGPRVARLGVRGVLSLPLILPDQMVVGALNCYSRAVNAFDTDASRLGALFATSAAVAVHNSQVFVRARTQAEQLQAALSTRAVIDQAIGIIRSRSGATNDEAFGRLRQLSQGENVKLAVVAERIVEEAARRARARHGLTDPAAR